MSLTDATSANPLLASSSLPFGLPPFADITLEHCREAVLAGMAEQRTEVAAITGSAEPPTFENTVVALERSGRLLRRANAVLGNLSSSLSTPRLREIERELARVQWAPRLNVSAMTGRAVDKLAPALHTALEGWETRISTGKLNTWIAELVAQTPPPVRSGKQPKILFATQAGTRPPRFVLFASGFLEAGYRRFVERRLREDFGFVGSPIEVSVKVREKNRKS